MKKTLLVGNFGAHNIGDEMILSAALETYPDVVVMTADPDWTRTFCEAGFETTLFPPVGLRSWGRFLTSSVYRKQILGLKDRVDKVVFVGGGLFAIKTRACWIWWQVFTWLRFLLGHQTPIIFEHQGVDEHLSLVGHFFAQKALRGADYISVRDEASQRAVLAMGINDVVLSEDRAFMFFQHYQPKADASARIGVFNALSHVPLETWDQIFDQAEGFELVFLLFEPKDQKYVPENFPGKVFTPKTKTELLSLLSMTKFFVGERLHAIILGTCVCGAASTKLLQEPYSEKVASFTQKHGITQISV